MRRPLLQPYRQRGPPLSWKRPPEKKKKKSPQGTVRKSFTQRTTNIWKMLKMKPATKPEMKVKRPLLQLQLHPVSLTVTTIAVLNIVMQMTRLIHGTGHPAGVVPSGSKLAPRAEARVKVTNSAMLRESVQVFSLDTLAVKAVGPVTSLHLSLRLAQGVPLQPRLHHGRRRRPVSVQLLPVLRHHLVLVLLVPVLLHLLLVLLLLLRLLPLLVGRLHYHLDEQRRLKRGLRDHRRGAAAPRLRRRV